MIVTAHCTHATLCCECCAQELSLPRQQALAAPQQGLALAASQQALAAPQQALAPSQQSWPSQSVGSYSTQHSPVDLAGLFNPATTSAFGHALGAGFLQGLAMMPRGVGRPSNKGPSGNGYYQQ